MQGLSTPGASVPTRAGRRAERRPRPLLWPAHPDPGGWASRRAAQGLAGAPACRRSPLDDRRPRSPPHAPRRRLQPGLPGLLRHPDRHARARREPHPGPLRLFDHARSAAQGSRARLHRGGLRQGAVLPQRPVPRLQGPAAGHAGGSAEAVAGLHPLLQEMGICALAMEASRRTTSSAPSRSSAGPDAEVRSSAPTRTSPSWSTRTSSCSTPKRAAGRQTVLDKWGVPPEQIIDRGPYGGLLRQHPGRQGGRSEDGGQVPGQVADGAGGRGRSGRR